MNKPESKERVIAKVGDKEVMQRAVKPLYFSLTTLKMEKQKLPMLFRQQFFSKQNRQRFASSSHSITGH